MEEENNILIWHPRVHFRFQETLCFFLLRARPFERDVLFTKLVGFLESLDLQGYQIYMIFGSYDVIMRVWLPVGEDRDFADQLEKKIPEIYHCNPFTSCRVQTCWAWGKMSEPYAGKFLNSLSLEEIRSIQQDKNKKLYQQVEQHNLLKVIERDLSNKNGQVYIRFFISIDFAQAIDTEQRDFVMDNLYNLIQQLEKERIIIRTSLYTGIGFALILLKSETEDIYNIKQVLTKITPHIKGLHGTTFTHVVADMNTIHCEKISERALYKMESKDPAVNALIPELYESKLIKQAKRASIEKWIIEEVLQYDLSKQHQESIHDALVGLIKNNASFILDAFFHAFVNSERILRENLSEFIGRTLGNEAIIEIFHDAGIRDKNKLLSLGDLLTLYDKTLKKQTMFKSPSDLEGGWQDIAKLRNDVAHGKIQNFTKWKKPFCVFVHYLARLDKLINIIENVVEKSLSSA